MENSLNISSKDLKEERLMLSKSDNLEFMPYDNANEVVGELFKSLFQDTKVI